MNWSFVVQANLQKSENIKEQEIFSLLKKFDKLEKDTVKKEEIKFPQQDFRQSLLKSKTLKINNNSIIIQWWKILILFILFFIVFLHLQWVWWMFNHLQLRIQKLEEKLEKAQKNNNN